MLERDERDQGNPARRGYQSFCGICAGALKTRSNRICVHSSGAGSRLLQQEYQEPCVRRKTTKGSATSVSMAEVSLLKLRSTWCAATCLHGNWHDCKPARQSSMDIHVDVSH
jgi:hypothetical protein